jgi:hypothetical protein
MINLPEDIPAPHFGINRGTVLPVFGLANRDKDMELMRWVGYVMRQTLRRKRNDIMYYSAIAVELAKQPLSPHSLADQMPLTPILLSKNTTRTEATGTLKGHHQADPAAAVFEVDLDAPLAPALPPPKKFNINLHLQILHRDLEELMSFYKEVCNVISRTTQRVKERLGRRVWAGKDIYLLHEDKRGLVSRQTWTNIVRFKRNDSQRRSLDIRQDSPYMRPNFVPGRRRLSSSAVENQSLTEIFNES